MTQPHTPPARARVLVVEDSSVFREMQALLLRQAGFGVWSFEDPAAALHEAQGQTFELAVIDYELPGMNGAQFMQALRGLQPGIPVIFVSGSLTLDLVGALSRQGAAGIFSKPANPKLLLEKIRETLNRAAREHDLRAGADLDTGVSRIPFPLPEPAADRLAYDPHYVYGASEIFRQFTHRLWRVRDFRSVLLLQGENGSPFELLAHELIDLSAYRGGPVLVCQAGEFEPCRLTDILSPLLLTPEPGTLIVHGVEKFSAAQQSLLAELLSVRGMFQPFARRFRLMLTATSRLVERVDERAFDVALYYKLSSLCLTIPGLAEMRGDIPVNATRLLQHLQSTVAPRAPVALAPDAVEWLGAQSWPGNYLQLAETLAFAVRHADGPEVSATALSAGALDYETELLARDAASRLPLLSSPPIVAESNSASPLPAAAAQRSGSVPIAPAG